MLQSRTYTGVHTTSSNFIEELINKISKLVSNTDLIRKWSYSIYHLWIYVHRWLLFLMKCIDCSFIELERSYLQLIELTDDFHDRKIGNVINEFIISIY